MDMRSDLGGMGEALFPSRLLCYRLFQVLFGEEITARKAKLICGDPSRAALNYFGEKDDLLAERASRFFRELALLLTSDALVSEARDEYMRLFVGPDKLVAPPWESVYLGDGRMLFQKSTLDVRMAYRKQGYRAAGAPKAADDHIAIELDYMAELSDEMWSAYIQDDFKRVVSVVEASKSFLDDHLLKWIPRFVRDIGCNSSKGYYLSAATLLERFLLCDRKELEKLF